jgi:PAS domain S-box-containing protein
MTRAPSRWKRRWSSLGLRSKALIVVGWPAAPLAFFWILLIGAAVRQVTTTPTVNRRVDAATLLARIDAALGEAEAASREAIAGGGFEAGVRVREASARVPPLLNELETRVTDSRVQALARELREEAMRHLESLTSVLGREPRETSATLDRARESHARVRRSATAILDRQFELAVEASRRSRQTSRVWLVVLLGGTSLGLGLGIFAAIALARGIGRRATALSSMADALARGEPIVEPPAGDDEIARLGRRVHEASLLLLRRDEEIRRAAQTFDTFFNLSDDLFCIAGFDGYFKRLNPVWERVLGAPLEDLYATPFLELVHSDDRRSSEAATAQLMEGRAIVSFENRFRHRDGSYRRLLWNARSVVDERLIYGSARDVTSQHEAAQALQRQRAELEASNRELEAFSYSVSHDLRAPLRAIDGFSQVIQEEAGDRLDEASRGSLRRVRAAATRMGTLIDELLNLSRLSRQDLRRETVDLSAIAAAVVADLRRRDLQRRVDVAIAPHMMVHADPRMLRIAVTNLLDNAWKYTGRLAEARVEFAEHRDNGERVFFVRDNGAGFDMAYADKLFTAFQRLHSDREFDGTGIGLATVQRIVRRHGGRIWAESAVGAGATFRFTIEPPSSAEVS